MNFAKHWELKGKHAFLSASQYHWLNYDEDKLITVYKNNQAKELGTRLHDFACNAIELGVLLDDNGSTVSTYVNDAISYDLKPEQILYYSKNCFGTADAINFYNGTLRIHDLKTGKTPASFMQLEIYAALFCLEYDVNPIEINTVLRIYQNNEILESEPEPDQIIYIMEKIITFDRIIDSLRMDG